MELNINISHGDDKKSGGVNVRISGSDDHVKEVVDYLLDCECEIVPIERDAAEYAHEVNDPEVVSAILNWQIFTKYAFFSAIGEGDTGYKPWYFSHT